MKILTYPAMSVYPLYINDKLYPHCKGLKWKIETRDSQLVLRDVDAQCTTRCLHNVDMVWFLVIKNSFFPHKTIFLYVNTTLNSCRSAPIPAAQVNVSSYQWELAVAMQLRSVIFWSTVQEALKTALWMCIGKMAQNAMREKISASLEPVSHLIINVRSFSVNFALLIV